MLIVYILNIAALCVVLVQGSAHGLAAVMLSVAFLSSSACFTHTIFSRSLSVTSFTLMLYWVYGYVLAGIYQIRVDTFYWGNLSVRRELIDDAAFITMVSSLMLSAGYFLSVVSEQSDVKKDTNNLRVMRDEWGNTPRATLIVSLLSFSFLLAMLAKFGPLAFFGTRAVVSGTFLADGKASAGLTLMLCRGMGMGAFTISAFVFFRLGMKNRITRISLILSVVSVGISNFPTGLSRFMLVGLMVMVVSTAFFDWFLRWKRVLYISAPLLMFLVFPFLASYNRRGADFNLSYKLPDPLEGMVHGDYDGLQAVMNVVGLVQQEGFSYGGRILSSIFFFVPRSIWPGKYNPTGSEAAASAGYNFLNISAPLPSEFYADFGMLGVAVLTFIVGWTARRLDALYESGGKSETIIIGIVLAGFLPILARGPLLGVINAPASVIFLIVMWSILRRAGGVKTIIAR